MAKRTLRRKPKYAFDRSDLNERIDQYMQRRHAEAEGLAIYQLYLLAPSRRIKTKSRVKSRKQKTTDTPRRKLAKRETPLVTAIESQDVRRALADFADEVFDVLDMEPPQDKTPPEFTLRDLAGMRGNDLSELDLTKLFPV